MLRKVRLNGTLICDVAHMKISRVRNGHFDLHLLLVSSPSRKIQKVLCRSFPAKNESTIESDCIATLLNKTPEELRIQTEVYFKGKLILTLRPTR